MTVLPALVKVSTSRVSLNDRFTGLMKSRAQPPPPPPSSHYYSKAPSSGHNSRPTANTDTLKARRQRAVERYDHPPSQQRVSLPDTFLSTRHIFVYQTHFCLPDTFLSTRHIVFYQTHFCLLDILFSTRHNFVYQTQFCLSDTFLSTRQIFESNIFYRFCA